VATTSQSEKDKRVCLGRFLKANQAKYQTVYKNPPADALLATVVKFCRTSRKVSKGGWRIKGCRRGERSLPGRVDLKKESKKKVNGAWEAKRKRKRLGEGPIAEGSAFSEQGNN